MNSWGAQTNSSDLARVQPRLDLLARVEKLPAAPVQLLVEPAYERESFACQCFL